MDDRLANRFRVDTVPTGAWITLIMCASGFVYIGVFGESDRRVALHALTAIALIGGMATLLLPWDAIVRSRWREPAFLGWTISDVAIICLIAWVDGGGDSPLIFSLVIPIIFASLSYPRWSVAVVGASTVLAYVVLAVATGVDGGVTLMFASTLVSATLMAVWQAHNHDRWREELVNAALTDHLTGALNRRGFQEAAASVLAALDRHGQPAALILIDLDRFKAYNDAFGHAAGDALLRMAVERMRPAVRPTDHVARIGGDEFAVLLAGADEVATRRAVARLENLLGPEIPHSAGTACAPADGTDLETLYRRADARLYDVKRRAISRARADAPAPAPSAS